VAVDSGLALSTKDKIPLFAKSGLVELSPDACSDVQTPVVLTASPPMATIEARAKRAANEVGDKY